MLLSKKLEYKTLSMVEHPKYIVFCDFDETYFPHTIDEQKQQDIYELEDYLEQKSKAGELLIGWVTGSSIESILDKMGRGKFRYFPHFIASDLGTEITYFSEHNFGQQDNEWNSRINEEFSKEKIEILVKQLHENHNILLNPQTQLGTSRYKHNFYYQEQDEISDKKNLLVIEKICEEYGVSVNINRCNPLAGDPEDSYDVDFIPMGTGKNEIVKFMLEKYNLNTEKAIAFGDSGNDVRMLQAVGNGYLLKNATQEAKNLHQLITDSEYSKGITNTLKKLIG
ncbi:HAD-IIB family hydrolase [Bacillus cabrialesii]|uniref:HAD-IIB family hydrolase n=1 Tax=Bacillus cabrialesii subsp. tritici TaxID=2944916 RepID=A0ABT9DI88_9BACI|nr:HAD-IIB family hydrolase [Bacillus cabrialesii]MDO8224384.1 HAD-IIB family hydrolase [Bacillus cabrialesii subsp. tritici]